MCFLDCDCPSRQLFGADIDESAFAVLSNLPGYRGHENNFIRKDFLELNLGAFGRNGGFDVIVGNPPYVSHHNMTGLQKRSASALSAHFRPIDRRSSLWAYFVFHSLSFLRRGGRLALILPTSFLYADYGKAVQVILRESFSAGIALRLVERMFGSEGTSEAIVVLLCEGYLEGNQQELSVRTINNIAELKDALETNPFSSQSKGAECDSEDHVVAVLKESFERAGKGQIHFLGDIFDIRIGLVTGANRFFVLSEKDAKSKGINGQHLTPLAVKLSNIRGLSLTSARFNGIAKSGERCLLVDSERITLDDNVSDYLATYPEEKRVLNVTFGKRSPWYKVNDGIIPNAFLGYLAHTSPRLVLNRAEATCTNNLHRLFLKKPMRPVDLARVAIASWSTVYQFSAELEGRPYGAGALKIEPSRARRLLLPISQHEDQQVLHVYRKVCHALADEDEMTATQIADHFLFKDDARLSQVQESLRRVRVLRFGGHGS